jgi:multidrug efflux pump subunit AcrA (membrane-fusion protein)
MSGIFGYAFGFEDGRSSTEITRRNREVVDQVFYGQRLVQVDQSYLDQLAGQIASLHSTSDHNLDKARLFRSEALEWRADAQRREANAVALQAQVAELQTQLANRNAEFATEHAAQETAVSEIYGLSVFRQLSLWLLEAHDAGRSDRPAFAELRALVKDLSGKIGRFERVTYDDKPDELARIEALVDALQRP